ncbi:dTDP-glucose 4,6-dehydratase, partial [hydrothermal vent metagenome]
GYEVFNLGESRTIMLKELIALIEKEVGKKANIEKLPLQPGDVEQTYADISKAKEMLGYDPQYEIEEGIKNFIEWLKNS